MGSQIPDEGKAGPQSQLNEAWIITSQKGRMPGWMLLLEIFLMQQWHDWSPAFSGCGLHGKLLGKPQGCKQEEPNVFQPPLHMFSKHCFSDQLKSCVVTPASQTYSVNMRPETGTVRPRCVH